jgi:hypothetical protein
MKKHLMTIVLSLCVVSISFAQKIDQSFFDKFPTLDKSYKDKDIRKMAKDKIYLTDAEIPIIYRTYDYNENIIPIGKLETPKAYILVYGAISKDEVDLTSALISINSIAIFKKNGQVVDASLRSFLTSSNTDFSVRNEAEIEVRANEYVFIYTEIELATKKTKKRAGVYSVRRNYLGFDRHEE